MTRKSFDVFASMAAIDLNKRILLEPVKDGEQIIGVLPDNLRRLHRVLVEIIENRAAIRAHAMIVGEQHSRKHNNETETDHDCSEFHAFIEETGTQLEELAHNATLVNEMMTAAIQLHFPEVDNIDASTIRDGEVLVAVKITAELVPKVINRLLRAVAREKMEEGSKPPSRFSNIGQYN